MDKQFSLEHLTQDNYRWSWSQLAECSHNEETMDLINQHLPELLHCENDQYRSKPSTYHSKWLEENKPILWTTNDISLFLSQLKKPISFHIDTFDKDDLSSLKNILQLLNSSEKVTSFNLTYGMNEGFEELYDILLQSQKFKSLELKLEYGNPTFRWDLLCDMIKNPKCSLESFEMSINGMSRMTVSTEETLSFLQLIEALQSNAKIKHIVVQGLWDEGIKELQSIMDRNQVSVVS